MKKNLGIVEQIVFVLMLFGQTACSSDDEVEPEVPIDTSSVFLFVEGTKTIDGNISQSRSENIFVASINNNIITANHVGETTVVVNEKYKIPIVVMPKYIIMTSEPILDWGISKAEVKSRWKLGTLSKETEDVLTYNNCGDATLVGYGFKNGKLASATVAVQVSKAIKFTNYLTERFYINPYEIDDKYTGFDSYSLENAKTSIIYDVSGNYKIGTTKVYVCLYLPSNK